MGCLQKPIWNKYTRQELEHISIDIPDEAVRRQVIQNWDRIAKPLDGLGGFEKMIAGIGAICGSDRIDISKRAVIILCADNGIVEEGVSQTGQEVTAAVAGLMGKDLSSVGKMAQVAGVDTIPVDIGINSAVTDLKGVKNRRIANGTANFSKAPAMTEEQTVKAIATGIELVFSCKEAGYRILATGEMGIGNTTTSSAVAAALLKCDAQKVTGRGAGLSDAGLIRKQEVIRAAIEKYDLYHVDAFEILKTVGGLDIAGLTGVCIGGAICHLPIVLDGVISMVAALVAERLFPGVREYLIPSHKGKEPAVKLLTKELRLAPVIDAGMALGEGTGAVMLFPLLDMALAIYNSGSTFSNSKIEQYERF
ncbi:MAG: nicotinate-nucleotide--dimethylbenzimidazole phosphoribosyltransferase [Agathobacter sp.]|nr:nicotinate-nucleotide--dimethylbenzimidazole phosphoribosyltransferase [Agathobacter sp.]